MLKNFLKKKIQILESEARKAEELNLNNSWCVQTSVTIA